MVVLEGSAVLSSVNNQYLEPDYLSSLPITLDAKKSPLALLAQTCSQIGVDTPTTKLLYSPTEKSRTSLVTDSPLPQKTKTFEQGLTSEENRLHLKSCEKAISKRIHTHPAKCSVQDSVDENKDLISIATSCVTPNYLSAKSSPSQKSTTPSTRCASPLNSYTKDSLPCGVSEELTSITNDNINIYYSNPEQSNPAFRSSFPETYSFHYHPVVLSSGYTSASSSPFSNFVRVKTNSGGERSACKDPYCTGCQLNMHNQQIVLNSASCLSDCSQCDTQKYNLAMAMSCAPRGIPASLAYIPLIRPYMCNWISSDIYCGKRFVTSEELLQHLRSHTTGVDTVSEATSSMSLINPSSLFTSTALHRLGYVNSINSLSPMRYHPYSKATLQTLIGSSYSAFNPTMFGPYYLPYTAYSNRPGATTVPP